MRFESLAQWLEWQENLHPSEIDLGLDRIDQVWKKLKSSSSNPVVITVAGTNGKGSTVALLETIYSLEGYSVGSYSSPHLLRYNERIRIKQKEVEDLKLCEAFELVDQARDDISLSYFEFGTLAAFVLFQEANLEVLVLEVGLGGRLDAVNIIESDCAIVTSISLDHCEWLGDSREKIGFEKAGIFRKKKPAICVDPDPPQSIRDQAQQIGAKLFCIGQDIIIGRQAESWDCVLEGDDESYQCRSLPYPIMRGESQLRNACAAISACVLLRQRLPTQKASIRQALQMLKLPGRFDVIYKKCQWVLDVAHNPAAVAALTQNLKSLQSRGTTYAIFAVMADKDVSNMLSSINEHIQQWFIIDMDNDRALAIDELTDHFRALKLHNCFRQCNSVSSAVKQVSELTKDDDLVVVFGSFLIVGQVYQALEEIKL